MEGGYDEANKILNDIYGKDIKGVLDFYSKLARIVQNLNTKKKLDSAQCLVYTLMNKLGPMREIIAQQNDDLEDWDLEELMEDMRNTQWETHFKMNAIVIIKMRATASDIKDTERKIAITTMQNYIYLLWKWSSFK